MDDNDRDDVGDGKVKRSDKQREKKLMTNRVNTARLKGLHIKTKRTRKIEIKRLNTCTR